MTLLSHSLTPSLSLSLPLYISTMSGEEEEVQEVTDFWVQTEDESTGKEYFYHSLTMETRWDRPDGLIIPESELEDASDEEGEDPTSPYVYCLSPNVQHTNSHHQLTTFLSSQHQNQYRWRNISQANDTRIQ